MPQATRHSEWKHYLWALIVIGIVTAVNLLAYSAFPWLGYQVVGLTDLFAVLMIAVFIGRGPALLVAAVSAISWNFLFITPRLTLEVSKLQDLVLLVLYFAIALIAGNLTARIRSQERVARRNAERNSALYRLAHDTATALNMDDILSTAVTQIGNVFDARVAILLTKGDTLDMTAHPASTYEVNDKDYSVALWVYENRKTAGRYTDTLPLATAQYFPLLTPSLIVGVIGISLRRDERLSFDKEVLLETFINQVALVIERELLSESAEQSAMLQESERLYSVLLNSISHELRTPIATIMGAASGLVDPYTGANEQARVELTQAIQVAADRLNRLVENLLDMSRLESGRMRLKLDWCDVGDIIGVAAKRFDNCFQSRPLKIQLPPDLPLVQLDYVLIEQVLVNLLDNTCNYTPPGTQIQLSAQMRDHTLEIVVSDNGPGLPADDFERVFEKFYRVKGSISGGTGLGLSICRGLVESHGGTMTAGNNADGGASFCHSAAGSKPAAASPGGCGMSEGLHVLVVDDEVQIRRFLKISLEANGYSVYETDNGQDALVKAAQLRPDIVILDIGLPDMSGIEVLSRLREWDSTPVIMLSVRDSDRDKVAALDAGADDYLTKPFSMDELMARMRVAERHARPNPASEIFITGDLHVDLSKRIVTVRGEPIKLTPTEYALLRLMIQHAGKVLTHRQILREVWGPEYVNETHYLRVYFAQLRQKIENDPALPQIILTEPGVGYRLSDNK